MQCFRLAVWGDIQSRSQLEKNLITGAKERLIFLWANCYQREWVVTSIDYMQWLQQRGIGLEISNKSHKLQGCRSTTELWAITSCYLGYSFNKIAAFFHQIIAQVDIAISKLGSQLRRICQIIKDFIGKCQIKTNNWRVVIQY